MTKFPEDYGTCVATPDGTHTYVLCIGLRHVLSGSAYDIDIVGKDAAFVNIIITIPDRHAAENVYYAAELMYCLLLQKTGIRLLTPRENN